MFLLTSRMIRGRNTESNNRTMRSFDYWMLLLVILTVNVHYVRSDTIEQNATMKPVTLQTDTCSLANITALQQIQTSCDSRIAYLYIKTSHFDMFPQVFDYFPNLQSIDISWAGIQHIESTTFDSAIHLSMLDMSESNMRTLANSLFTRVNNLTSLDIANSSIETVETYAFNGLRNLRRLDLSGNKIVALDTHLFQPLSRLQTLRLSNNKIEIISNAMFMHNSQLEFVYLSSNRIIFVDPNAFVHCQLKLLDLGSNQLNDVDVTTSKHLNELIVSNNQLNVLKVPSVVSKVYAENNSIDVTHSDSEKNELFHLYLSSNHITNLSSLADFHKLEFLDLSNNHMTVFPFADVRGLTHLKELQLCRNKLAEIRVEDVVTNLPNLKCIHLSTKHWSNSYVEQLQSDLKNRSIMLLQNRDDIPDNDSSIVTTIRPAVPVTVRTTVTTSTQSPDYSNIEQQLLDIRKQFADLEYRMGAKADIDNKKIDSRLADVNGELIKANNANDAKLESLRSSFKVYEVLVIIVVAGVTVFVLYQLVVHSKRMLNGMQYRRTQSNDPIFSEQDL